MRPGHDPAIPDLGDSLSGQAAWSPRCLFSSRELSDTILPTVHCHVVLIMLDEGIS